MRARLATQRKSLAADFERIAEDEDQPPAQGGKVHLIASMFEDSLAPSWTPRGIVDARLGSALTAPAVNGYLIEVERSQLARHANHVRTASSIEARTAISRVQSISTLSARYVLRGQSPPAVWNQADEIEGGRAFIIWLAPYIDQGARAAVIATLRRMEQEESILPTYSGIAIPPAGIQPNVTRVTIVSSNDQTAVSRAARRYRADGSARAYVRLPNQSALRELAASGAVLRIDPVRKIEVMSPSVGAEPNPPLPRTGSQPIVAVIDGGLTAQSYLTMEAWRAPALVANRVADHAHGNRVSSLVVHAHAWNNRLNLPKIECQLGTVQAVPRAGSNIATNTEMLVDYLRQVARRNPDAKVWNMSFNQVTPEADLSTISYLGHEISQIAREFDILPVISIGNLSASSSSMQLCPPADCEAAITVSGRKYDANGTPAGQCDVSLQGPGPDGMIKPDVSWYSTLKMVGGGHPLVGSSYAVPLVSSLAAHTYANLKDPSPDLVKALLIDRAELEEHDNSLGWGTPYDGTLPWLCEPGTVTMAWRSQLTPGYAYYWNDIPIPPELVKGDKLFGKARLTAILKPLVSQQGGPNYFSTRLQVALQYEQASGATGNLLGSMREDTTPEREARSDLAKWNPVRRHARDFARRGGLTFTGTTMRLHARVFARDLFQYQVGGQRELGEQEVAFVLTFRGGSEESDIYNSTAQRLSTFVESAVLNQELEIEVGAQ